MACARIGAAAPEHCLAALGESLLGSSTFLFLLLKPCNHPLHSRVLDGVPRPVPQLCLPISNRESSFSFPFLSCHFIGSGHAAIAMWGWACGRVGSYPGGSLDTWRKECQGAPSRLPLRYLWALDQHTGGLICGVFLLSLPSAFLKIWHRFGRVRFLLLLASPSPSSDAHVRPFFAT